MLVSLPNGKTIEMSVDQYLSMTDEDYQYLVAAGVGEEISDPFHNSYIKHGENYSEEEFEEIDEEIDLDEEEEF